MLIEFMKFWREYYRKLLKQDFKFTEHPSEKFPLSQIWTLSR